MGSLIERQKNEDDQEEVDQRDKKFPEPPSFYKNFVTGSDAYEPPDLARLAKKDYFLLYE